MLQKCILLQYYNNERILRTGKLYKKLEGISHGNNGSNLTTIIFGNKKEDAILQKITFLYHYNNLYMNRKNNKLMIKCNGNNRRGLIGHRWRLKRIRYIKI